MFFTAFSGGFKLVFMTFLLYLLDYSLPYFYVGWFSYVYVSNVISDKSTIFKLVTYYGNYWNSTKSF